MLRLSGMVVRTGDEIGRRHFHGQLLGDVECQNHIVGPIKTNELTYLMGRKWTSTT